MRFGIAARKRSASFAMAAVVRLCQTKLSSAVIFGFVSAVEAALPTDGAEIFGAVAMRFYARKLLGLCVDGPPLVVTGPTSSSR
jgi:hypothetical protein